MKYPKIKDFNDFLSNCGKIKQEYGGILSPNFSLKYVHEWREYIYSRTNISMNGRHAIWEYLNYDIDEFGLIALYYKCKKK